MGFSHRVFCPRVLPLSRGLPGMWEKGGLPLTHNTAQLSEGAMGRTNGGKVAGHVGGPQPTPAERSPTLRTGRSYRVDDLSPTSQDSCSQGSEPCDPVSLLPAQLWSTPERGWLWLAGDHVLLLTASALCPQLPPGPCQHPLHTPGEQCRPPGAPLCH